MPKYKVNNLEQDSDEIKFVHRAISGTVLKGVPLISSLIKVFKVATKFEGAFTDRAGSRLFFYGCSEKVAVKILEHGFLKPDFFLTCAQFGNGCYLTPSSTTAAYNAAINSRKNSVHASAHCIFLCEVRKFESRSRAQKRYELTEHSTIDHYHGMVTFDRSKDVFSPSDGIPVSCGLVPRTVEAIETSMLVDEIVVRHDEVIRPVYLAKVVTNEYLVKCAKCQRK